MSEEEDFEFRLRYEKEKESALPDSAQIAVEEPKQRFSEKVGDLLTGGMISEGREIQADARAGNYGEKSKTLAEGSAGLEGVMRTGGQLGQSIILANATTQVLSKVPAIANVIGKQKVVQGLVASSKTKAANTGIKMSNAQRALQRNFIEAAVAVQVFDYDDIKDRIKTTAIAGALGLTIGLTFSKGAELGSKIVRKIRKFEAAVKGDVKTTSVGTTRDPRMPALKKVQNELSAAESEASQIAQSTSKQITQKTAVGRETQAKVVSREQSLKDAIKRKATDQERAVRSSVKETKRQIDKSIEQTNTLLNQEADIAAKTYQSKVTGFFRQNSAKYGKELDAISDSIAETGRMTRGEALDVLEGAIQRSGSEAEITGGKTIAEIKKLIDSKYAAESIDEVTGVITSRNLDELVPFKEFLRETRNIWKNIKPAKSGARFSQDEIPAAILQSEFGELVSRIPGGEVFKDLQAAYRPVISYMNKANSVLQPYKGEAYRKGAFELVKRVAKDEGVAPVEKDIVNFIEAGTERFAKGVGSYSGRARQLGDNLKVLKQEMEKVGLHGEKRLFQIAEDTAMKVSKIDSASSGAQALIEKETAKQTALIMEESANLQMKTWARIKQLQSRGLKVDNQMRRLQMIKNLETAAVTTIGGLTATYVVLRGGRQLLQTIGDER